MSNVQGKRPTGYLTDFAGGVDPFGTLTFKAARRNQEAGVKDHGIRRAISTAGGFIGGSLVVTPMLLGATAALMNRGAGGGALNRFAKGAVAPFSKLFHTQRVLHGAQAAQQGKTVGQGVFNSAKKLFNDIYPDAGKHLSADQLGKGFNEYFNTKVLGDPTVQFLKQQRNKAITTLGLTGGVGAGAAYLQYGAGRDIGKEMQQREAGTYKGA